MAPWFTCVLVAFSYAQPPTDQTQPFRTFFLAARREQVELLLKAVQRGEEPGYEDVATAVRRLADQEVVAGNPEAGLAWCEKWVAALSNRWDKLTDRNWGFGSALNAFVRAREALIEAKIELGSRQVAPSSTRIELYRERVKLFTNIEKLAAKMAEADSGARADYLSQKAVRLRAEAELAEVEAAIERGGE